MINANELRMGNWVDLAGEKVPQKVNIKILQFITHANAINDNHPFEPILLSPEILEKARFSKKNLDDDVDGDFWCLKEGYRFLFEYHKAENVFYNGKLGIQIKYLHQLQNLYYALTGEELEINLQ